jgi:hypothetical protein
MDNSGTKVEAAARCRPDMRERTEQGSGASRCPLNATARANALLTEFRDTSRVRRWKSSHDQVNIRQGREHIEPYDFAKPAFHTIAIDGGVRISRHDDACPGMTQKGSDVANLEVRGSDSLPLQADRVERAFPRQPIGAREAAMVRCPRTSTAA